MNQALIQPAPAGTTPPPSAPTPSVAPTADGVTSRASAGAVTVAGAHVHGLGDTAQPDPLLALVLQSLDDDQAQDVVTIPLAGKTTIADYMVIASGRSSRQVTAMAQKLAERIKHGGMGHSRIEGLPVADWVLVDASGVIVHLFRPEVRSFYNLERMWGFGDPPQTGPA